MTVNDCNQARMLKKSHPVAVAKLFLAKFTKIKLPQDACRCERWRRRYQNRMFSITWLAIEGQMPDFFWNVYTRGGVPAYHDSESAFEKALSFDAKWSSMVQSQILAELPN